MVLSRSDTSFEMNSFIHGHHIYKDAWALVVGEELSRGREEGNILDLYAVATVKSGNIIGHAPRQISAACASFMLKGVNFMQGYWAMMLFR